MMLTSHHLQTTRTARYFTLGDIAQAKDIWIVLHGYGFLAEDFIKGFMPISNENVAIVAPEGLSRFYLKGFGGGIGASWMTREDRSCEIDDQSKYLNNLFIVIRKLNPSAPITTVGFSQGGPAMLRWIATGFANVDNVVLWAADMPRDLNFTSYTRHTLKTRHWLVHSTKDPIVRQEIFQETIILFEKSGIPLNVMKYDGGHVITGDELVALKREIDLK